MTHTKIPGGWKVSSRGELSEHDVLWVFANISKYMSRIESEVDR